ncbi:hypothetical protein N657DRAFT_659645 [Parathielavia appendiculata]|uniref:Rhodopsin domain-containing protein n=1 Tax=Parathielavia appendiculata TaxID=2587402 RepID=A0AAN6YYF7_9PEZI|nr:hypothetical protein N657DRAFT_659645 [Parathielavia appendiculata]
MAGDRIDAHSLAPVGTFLGIACITTSLRVYWRLRPVRRIGADDLTLLLALILTIAWYGVDVAMYHYGRGIEGFSPDPWTMGPLVVADGVLWVWALNVIRISVALLLLRLKDSLPWRLALWVVISVQVCMLIVGTTMHLVMCQPISARWAPTPTARCIYTPYFMTYGYIYSGFTIASDLVLSLLPVTFIRTLHRPRLEKVLIGCLMTAGMAATGVAVARLFLIMGYLGKGSTALINVQQDILWGMELTIGAPVHRLMQSWGLLRSTSELSDSSSESFRNRLPNGSHITRQMREWSSMVHELAPQSREGLGTVGPAKLGAAAPTGFCRRV